MPKLWDATIDAHRREVRNAILDTTAAVVAQRGALSITMSQIAEGAGIARATLYKYFPDVEAILFAWHEREIARHLEQLADARDGAGGAGERLEAVLAAYALISHGRREHQETALAALLHRDEHVAVAERRLHDLLRELLTEAAGAGEIRVDIPANELASYCLHALAAAASLPSTAAVSRLVELTLAGVRG